MRHRFRSRSSWLTLLTVFMFIPGRSQNAEPVVAKVGTSYISEEEFVRRFELMPWPNRSRVSHLEESKREVLYSMIAEKLLADAAKEKDLEQDSVYQQLMLDMKYKLARDQLYREEVASRVSISDKELRQGIRRALKEIRVSFIFCPADSDARFVRSLIHSAKDFDRLQIDSTYGGRRDTATLVWGSGDPAIEEAAYSLAKGEVSGVIEAGPGYYILTLDHTATSATYAGMKPDVLQDRVRSTLRSRKEALRLNQYLGEVLHDKLGYSVPGPFRMLSNALHDVFQQQGTDSLITFTGEMLSTVRDRCGSSIHDTLTVAGQRVWSVDEIAALLCEKSFSVPREQLASLPRRLNGEIRSVVEQELLAEEAIRRGMDLTPGVRKELDRWSQFYLAAMMKSSLADRVTITPEEFASFVKTTGDTAGFPLVQIREVVTHTVDQMKSAVEALDQGMSFPEAAATYSVDPDAKRTRGLTSFFPAYDHPPIGEVAARMEPGDRYGPLQTMDGVFLFELVAKKESTRPDTATAARLAQMRSTLAGMKVRQVVNQYIARRAEAEGYTVFEDRLSALKVSPVAMVTFRFLGFGGRIFAVPFLERQIDWLYVQVPSSRIAP